MTLAMHAGHQPTPGERGLSLRLMQKQPQKHIAQAITADAQSNPIVRTPMQSIVTGSRLGHGPASAFSAACAAAEDTSASAASAAATAALTT